MKQLLFSVIVALNFFGSAASYADETKTITCQTTELGQLQLRVRVGESSSDINLLTSDSVSSDLLHTGLHLEISSTPSEQKYWAQKFLVDLTTARPFMSSIDDSPQGSLRLKNGEGKICLRSLRQENFEICTSVADCH